MPAISTNSTIAPSQAARQSAQIYANAQATNSETALAQAVSVALNTAIAAGLFTTTVSTTSYAGALVQDVMNTLQNLGYTCSHSTSTLTFNW